MQALIQESIERVEQEIRLSPEQQLELATWLDKDQMELWSYHETEMKLGVGDDEVVPVSIALIEGALQQVEDSRPIPWTRHGLAALVYLHTHREQLEPVGSGRRYTLKGMRRRVMEERLEKAQKASYRVELANNLYGEHVLTNEKGERYKITLHDFNKRSGYIDNIDWRNNKLGTTKHILFLYNYLESHPEQVAHLDVNFPFIDIYTDPTNDYKISWFFPEQLQRDEKELLRTYFRDQNYIEENQIAHFFSFVHKARDFARIVIRDEVLEKIEAHINRQELHTLEQESQPDWKLLHTEAFPYQEEGIKFALYRKGAIIADDMGLGKTYQAIGAAVFKKQLFGFRRTLVITPASVKQQWCDEVRRFTDERASVIDGDARQRAAQYWRDSAYFHVISYETVIRDLDAINKAGYDFVILDEAQKIKNYETKAAIAIKGIHKKHCLVITGTPIENKLVDLYSIMQFIDQSYLGPLWEFSARYCLFDTEVPNKIKAYYHLRELKERMRDILLRREKQQVFEQLPSVMQKDVYVQLAPEQHELHQSYAKGIAGILGKKRKSSFDWQKMMLLLGNMRRVCDSLYLIDKQSKISPKLDELMYILNERLDLRNSDRKVIVFSEWIGMLDLIGEKLEEHGIKYVMLSGKVPVKKRGDLIREFEENEDCAVFLSTESGGTGLNLQVADTVINFEIPWNPAKKNQRIGRIDRIGQRKTKLQVYNLIAINSIEAKIAHGLVLKQNLFEGVLGDADTPDLVDLSEKGREQFFEDLKEAMSKQEEEVLPEHDHLPLRSTHEEQLLLDFGSEDDEDSQEHAPPAEGIDQPEESLHSAKEAELQEIFAKGMEFLAGMYKIQTGQELKSDWKPEVNYDEASDSFNVNFSFKA